MPERNKIIVIGADESLVRSRAMVLRSRNYETTVGLELDALDLLQGGDYDLLLTCSSMSVERASELIRDAKRQAPKMCVVRLINPDEVHRIGEKVADEVVETDYHPMTWVKAVDRLLNSSGHPDRPVLLN